MKVIKAIKGKNLNTAFGILITLIICVIFINSLSCKKEEQIEVGLSGFSELTMPLVIFQQYSPEYAGTDRVLQSSGPSACISVFDFDSMSITGQKLTENQSGWSNSRAVFSNKTGRHYFFLSDSQELLSVDRETGNTKRTPVTQPYPGNIVGQASRDGYLILNHYNKEDQGSRIAVYDTTSEKVINDSLFIPRPWSYAVYNEPSNSVYLTVTESLNPDAVFDRIYKLDLDSFSLEHIQRTRDNYLVSALRSTSKGVAFAANHVMKKDSDGNWIKNINAPYLGFISSTTDDRLTEENLLTAPTDDYISTIASVDDQIIVVLESTIVNNSETMDIYKRDKKDSYRKINSQTLPKTLWNDIVVRDNSIYFITYDISSISMLAVSVTDAVIEKSAKIIVY